MKKLMLLTLLTAALFCASSGTYAFASPSGGEDSTHGILPGVYDPDLTGCVTATIEPQGLDLQKLCPTATNAAAGADVVGFNGQALTQLSLELKNGSHVGAGSPRFDVVFQDGTFRIFSAAYGTATDLGDGYTRYTFSDVTAFCDFATAEPGTCGFGNLVDAIDVLLDEEGVAVVRNVSVNGIVLNGPPVAAPAPAKPAPQVNRDGYCGAHDYGRADGTKGRFLDLEAFQPSVDPFYAGATPAYYAEGYGLTCDLPAGYKLVGGVTVTSAGTADGTHPYAKR